MWTVCSRYVYVCELYNLADERDFLEWFVKVPKRLHTHHIVVDGVSPCCITAAMKQKQKSMTAMMLQQASPYAV